MTVARLAATVVVLRAADAAPEILMVRRARGASFMADAFVFPGGRVDDADQDDALDPLARFRRAAARELMEEAAVHVRDESLLPFARWVTPSAEPKRFDTVFFVTTVPSGTNARVDEAEITEHVWSTAADLLARHERRSMKLPPPTLRTIEELAVFSDAQQIEAWARARPLDVIQPKLVREGDDIAIVLPWDPKYASEAGEGDVISPQSSLARGASRYVLRDGRFWAK